MLQGCHTLLLHRDNRAVLKLSHRLLKLAREHELGNFLQHAQRVRQWARLAFGRHIQDIADFTDTLNALRARGNKMQAPLMLGHIAEALAANDRAQEALDVIAEAMEVTERTGERWTEAELYRLRGVIALTRNGLDAIQQAEACFRRSMDISREQSAASWELRASTSLARLWPRPADAKRRRTSWRQSTTGSPKASTPPTSGTRGPCSMSSVSPASHIVLLASITSPNRTHFWPSNLASIMLSIG